MTGNQLQRLLDAAGLSQCVAARLIDISPRQMRRYIAGEASVPRAVEYALRWMIARYFDGDPSTSSPS